MATYGGKSGLSGSGQRADHEVKAGAAAYGVRDRLRQRIMEGEIAPGTVLTQTEVAREAGVSRTPVREAMRMLQNEGLLEAEPNNRARVRMFQPEDIIAIYTARIVLEALGVALSIPKLTDQDFAAMNASLARMTRHDQFSSFSTWAAEHREFHQLLIQHCGDGLKKMISRLNEQSSAFHFYVYNSNQEPKWWTQRHDGHVELVSAARAGNIPWATQLIAQHLAQTAFLLLGDVSSFPEKHATAISAALSMVSGGVKSLERNLPTMLGPVSGV